MVIVKLTCTDRNGRHLAQQEIQGRTFNITAKKRAEVYAKWLDEFKSDNGITPYIFSSTRETANY